MVNSSKLFSADCVPYFLTGRIPVRYPSARNSFDVASSIRNCITSAFQLKNCNVNVRIFVIK